MIPNPEPEEPVKKPENPNRWRLPAGLTEAELMEAYAPKPAEVQP